MTRRIFFDGDMNDENVKKFCQEIEQAERDQCGVIVYLSSPGGFECYVDVCVEICDFYPFDLEIQVTWIAESGAFLWCSQTKRKVRFLPVSSGGIHIASRQVHTRDMQDLKSSAMFLVMEMEKRNNKWLESIRPYVSEKEYEELIDGKLISMNAERAQIVSDSLAGRT